MKPSHFAVLFLVAALAGLAFAGVSTYDYIEHLDRQTHSIACSWVPGIVSTQGSGCKATLMSPYSAVLKSWIWGGVPITLPGMAVFSFLLYRGADLLLHRREKDVWATRYLAAISAIPLVTSLVMGYLSLVELGAACKICMGIYGSSFLAFLSSVVLWRSAESSAVGSGFTLGSSLGSAPVNPWKEPALATAGLGGFVLLPVLAYLGIAPDYSGLAGTCGRLPHAEDPNKVVLSVGSEGGAREGAPELLEVLDPLCPTCRGVERRLQASGMEAELNRKIVLFPLDNACNWTVGEALHPGACAISEAVLCAKGPQVGAVLDWAFAHQEEILEAAKQDPKSAEAKAKAAFPDIAACIGSAEAKAKLNKSLRWAVNNQLPVLTPQVFVNGQKLCDDDIDLGFDYSLQQLIQKGSAQ